MTDLENYFKQFRENIVGVDATFESPYGLKKIFYADWIASGRLYKPIEEKLQKEFGPFVANTHTETTFTGTLMTRAYQHSHEFIKKHVNAGENDVIITAGYGMTAVINKLMRILSLKGCGGHDKKCPKTIERPVVFLTHMEHHSNHTSWFETTADVVQLEQKLGYLRSQGHEVIVLQVLDPAEVDFSFDEPAMFYDLESNRQLYVDPETARQTYLEKFQQHQESYSNHFHIQSFHGHLASAEKAVRAWAIFHSFWEYCPRANVRKKFKSPAHKLNGFVYHDNWLHNMLISTSMAGAK